MRTDAPRLATPLHAVSLGLQQALQHKADFALGFVGAVFPLFVQYYLWSSLYAHGYAVPGYGYRDILLYSVLAAGIGRIVHTGFEYEVAGDIKQGQLARYLVQPVAYASIRLGHFLGTKLPWYAVVGAVMVGVLAWAGVDPLRIAAMLLAVALGLVLNVLIFFCIGFLCFWFDEAAYLFEGARIAIVALSGGIVPLAVFGPKAQAVLSVLPFRGIISIPIEIATGQLHGTALVAAFGLQAGWITAIALVAWTLWRRGLRAFMATGG